MNVFDKEMLSRLDREHVWHPFTQMKDLLAGEPLFIAGGKGCLLKDIDGNEYIDGTSSLWVNIHGHNVEEINEAIRKQLGQIAHSTSLGLANVPATLLAEKLVSIAPPGLARVFYSDDGSTAVEVALKMAFQYWRNVEGESTRRRKFVSLELGYHGDTLGAVSVGGIDLFHGIFGPLLFESLRAPAPYCYRCRFAQEPATCNRECVLSLRKIFAENEGEIIALILEPLVQGAAGFIVHPSGYLAEARRMCDEAGTLLIADEVATGFGRTGKMFACQHENVTPDLMCVAKGLTGGYLPLAATVTTESVFEAFLGDYSGNKTFFHGHSYTGNQLACVAALASLELFEKRNVLGELSQKIEYLRKGLERFWELAHVGDVRQCGFIGAVELVHDKKTRQPFPYEERTGAKVCRRARDKGALVRPLGDVVYFIPPYCIAEPQLQRLLDAAFESIREVTAARAT
ncbi:MAG: adenosylmethionine--8-amino-7-oxononanoate transaminase [bacterium]|nr:adenosylmethionine--8-amino-7-oxononanoate transaminase [bacterium]